MLLHTAREEAAAGRGGPHNHQHQHQQCHHQEQHHHQEEQQQQQITAANVYRLACAEFAIAPHDALLAALEGRGAEAQGEREEDAAAVAAVGEEEGGTRAVTLRGLVRLNVCALYGRMNVVGGSSSLVLASQTPSPHTHTQTHKQDERHVCAVALTVSHLQQQQQQQHPRRGEGRLRLRLHLSECAPGREGMRQLGMALAGKKKEGGWDGDDVLYTPYVSRTLPSLSYIITESDAVVGLSFAPSPALGEDGALLPILAGELRRATR